MLTTGLLFLSTLLQSGQVVEPSPRSLSYLADFVVSGPQEKDLGNGQANAAAKRLVTLAAIGMVLEAHPENSKLEKARQQIATELDALVIQPNMSTGAFGCWIYPFLTLYQCEQAWQRGLQPDTETLDILIGFMEEAQNVEGGWGHSSSGALSFYPSTLVATTNLNLLALGLAKTAGAKVDDEVIEAGFDLLRTVQGANGAMPYGGPAYRKGYEAGRTAASLLAFAAHDLLADSAYNSAANYIGNNLISIPHGHASTAMHLFLGGHAALLLPSAQQQAFDELVLEQIREHRTADGSFDDVVKFSPDTMLAFGQQGRVIDRAYVSALSTASLQAEMSQWAKRIRPESPAPLVKKSSTVALTLPKPMWSSKAPDAAYLISLSEKIAAVDSLGGVRFFHPGNGNLISELAAPKLAAGLHRELEHLSTPAALFQVLVDDIEGERLPFGVDSPDSPPPGSCILRCIPNEGEGWSKSFDAPISRMSYLDGVLHLLLQNGSYLALHADTGEEFQEWSASNMMVNTSLAPHADGTITLSMESRVIHHEADGFTVWEKGTSGKRGITPPAWSALLAQGEQLLLGDSQGEVQARHTDTGKGIWRNLLGGSIRFIKPLQALPGHVLVASSDGRLHALNSEDGETAWTTLFSFGVEQNQPLSWLEAKGSIWVHHPEAERLHRMDARTGAVLGTLGMGAGSTWTANKSTLFLAHDGKLEAIVIGTDKD